MNALRVALGRAGVFDDVGEPAPRRTRRDWVADSALFVLAAVIGTGALITSVTNGLGGPLLVVDALLGAGACLLLWWRRRWPVALGLACVPVIAVSSFAGGAGVVLLFTVAAYRRWQPAVLLAALQLMTLPVGRALHPQGDGVLSYYLSGTLGTAFVVGWGMLLRARRQAKGDRMRRDEAEQMLHLEQVRYAERTRIAREMHDVLAHRISLLSLHAGALEFRPSAPAEEVARAAGVIRASAHQALEDLRAVIGVLRDRVDDDGLQPPQPTLAALPGLLEESRLAGMRLTADLRITDRDDVPDAIGRHALRIVQEALTNARKHAPSSAVSLVVEGGPGAGLTIDVRNRAPVLAAGDVRAPGSGAGLVGMAERAALSGGRLEHRVDEHGDFQLHAWLPWPP